MGNRQLKSVLPGSEPSTPAAAGFSANLRQFTFRSKAQNQRTRPSPLRMCCSKGRIVKLLIPPAAPTCEQRGFKPPREVYSGWLKGTGNGQKYLCSDYRDMRMPGKRKPTARVKVSIHSRCKCKRESGRSMDVGKPHTQRPFSLLKDKPEEALWQYVISRTTTGR